MDPLVSELLGALLRSALTSVGTVLVAHHVWTSDQNDRFSAAVAEHVLLWSPLIASLLWVIWVKLRQRLTLQIALDLPAGSTTQDVQQALKSATVRQTISGVPSQPS